MIDASHDNSGKDHDRQPAAAADLGDQVAGGQPGDRRRDARVVPRRRPPGDRHATASSPTASRSPTRAWTGTPPSRCSTRLAGGGAGAPRGMRIAVLGVGPDRRLDRAGRPALVADAEVVGFGRDPARLERRPRAGRDRRGRGLARGGARGRRWRASPARPVGALPGAGGGRARGGARGLRGHRRGLHQAPAGGARSTTRASWAGTRSPARRRAGVEHARADLFQGAVWYLTPHRALRRAALRAPAPPA